MLDLNYRNTNPGDLVQGKKTGTLLRVLRVEKDGLFVEGFKQRIQYEDIEPFWIYPIERVETLRDIIMADPREDIDGKGDKKYEFWFGDYKVLTFIKSVGNKVSVSWREYLQTPTNLDITTDRFSDVQKMFFEASDGYRELPLTLPKLPTLKWRCLGCGRVMAEPGPHRCGSNFQKHHLTWENLIL